MSRAMILTGGVSHPFADGAHALAEILAEIGIESEIETDIERGLDAWSGQASFDLLAVYALRWRMLAERYAGQRDTWGFSLSARSRQAIHDGVAAGRPLLGLHTAAICFDDWPAWGEILGGAWVWDRSFHPPYGPAVVTPRAELHPIVRGLPQFDIMDEIYSDLVMQPGVVALATGAAGDGGVAWPVLWARHFQCGRVVCDLLGHDRAALDHPVHRRILRRAAAWALGVSDTKVSVL